MALKIVDRNKVFLGNLRRDVGDDEIYKTFAMVGILPTHVKTRNRGSASEGLDSYGIAVLKSREDAEKARIRLDGQANNPACATNKLLRVGVAYQSRWPDVYERNEPEHSETSPAAALKKAIWDSHKAWWQLVRQRFGADSPVGSFFGKSQCYPGLAIPVLRFF